MFSSKRERNERFSDFLLFSKFKFQKRNLKRQHSNGSFAGSTHRHGSIAHHDRFFFSNIHTRPTPRSSSPFTGRGPAEWVGNRRDARFPWKRGLRVPPFSVPMGFDKRVSVTVFVDGLPKNISNWCLRNLFSIQGPIVDTFVSRKTRKNSSAAFGFVRFKRMMDALAAIENMDGLRFRGCSMRVSLARYDRYGGAFVMNVKSDNMWKKKCPSSVPVIRDGRRYVDVLNGKTHTQGVSKKDKMEVVENVEKTNQHLNLLVACSDNQAVLDESSPKPIDGAGDVSMEDPYVPQAAENNKMADKILSASVVENGVVLNTELVSSYSASPSVSGIEVGKVMANPVNVTVPSIPLKTNVLGKVKRIQNHRDIALFLGYYSSAKEHVSHNH